MSKNEIVEAGGQFPTRRSTKFDRDSRDRFLRNYMLTGQIYASCRAAGVSEECYRQYVRDNINGFADEFEEAKGLFRDAIEAEIQRRAMVGWEEPVIGGKDRDQVVTTITKYSDRLLELFAKRHIDGYREKQQVDLNVSGGVMVVPERPKTNETWSEQYGAIPRPKDE